MIPAFIISHLPSYMARCISCIHPPTALHCKKEL